MNGATNPKDRAEVRDYLAAERTFLAWIRTGLALMGFGFVVARFGLFVQQLRVFQQMPLSSSSGPSLWIGTTLITVGVIVNLSAAWRHRQLVRDLDQGKASNSRSTFPAVATAVFLALVGIAMAIYLLSVRTSTRNSENVKEINMASASNKGIISMPSHHSVEQTVEKLKEILQSKGVILFALVDHSGEAEKAGMKMPPTKLLIFGSPKAGTPPMLAAPSIAIDLPLKILVSENAKGEVWVCYNSASYLQERHGLPPELLQNVAVVEALASKAAE